MSATCTAEDFALYGTLFNLEGTVTVYSSDENSWHASHRCDYIGEEYEEVTLTYHEIATIALAPLSAICTECETDTPLELMALYDMSRVTEMIFNQVQALDSWRGENLEDTDEFSLESVAGMCLWYKNILYPVIEKYSQLYKLEMSKITQTLLTWVNDALQHPVVSAGYRQSVGRTARNLNVGVASHCDTCADTWTGEGLSFKPYRDDNPEFVYQRIQGTFEKAEKVWVAIPVPVDGYMPVCYPTVGEKMLPMSYMQLNAVAEECLIVDKGTYTHIPTDTLVGYHRTHYMAMLKVPTCAIATLKAERVLLTSESHSADDIGKALQVGAETYEDYLGLLDALKHAQATT